MMSRVFITGATGYIGGDVLYGLANSGLASRIVALVRRNDRAAQVVAKHPAVTPLIGDLGAGDTIETAASQADVVLHLASSNHVASASSIAQGIAKTERASPVWIQISGASLLSGREVANNSYGNASSKVYSDLDDATRLREIIASSPKRVVDQLVTNLASRQPRVRTAIIYGPMIYGLGRGPVNQRSIQIPSLAKASLQNGHGLHVGKGLSSWSNVHVSDITQLVLKLVAASQSSNQQHPLWNTEGIYFADAGRTTFGDIAFKMASAATAHGLIESPSVKEIDMDAANSLTAHGAVLLGTNARTSGDRARKWLRWEPQGPSLDEEIKRAVADEVASYRSSALSRI